ncbi:ABC-type transport system involved in multi-copper enzyme maturation permease subunit [Arthrobacter silviterrae]|nr:ABC transporter permease [Arthrobacter silviterrae]MDQ0278510.1 ABC-type transport system involved in multi-copper enzyme maturation permease subunit [Arthrobacter silviterrae]
MTIMENGTGPAPRTDAGPSGLGAYAAGVWAVVGMELRQRLRARGWYIMLVVWFGLIWLVTALTWASWKVQSSAQGDFGGVAGSAANGPGPLIFEAVLAFVLLFGLLVAPALSANAISGDRAGGTLAIMQVTLLRPGQLLWGKFLASWCAALAFLVVSVPFLVFGILQGGLGAGHILVALLMLAIELGVVCALGVGVSALANRPLFSIVVTYLVVAALTFGTLIAFGLGMMVTDGTVQANQVYYKNSYVATGPDGTVDPSQPSGQPELPQDITDQNDQFACYGPMQDQRAPRTDRVAWLLGMNPFVVVADAIPYPDRTSAAQQQYAVGAFESISQGARSAQAGPEATYQCANGKVAASYLSPQAPLWPLGLGLQLLLTAGVLALAWRALRTPAGRLAKGTRVA